MAWYDLHFKLDKVKVVLLVVVDSTIEGTALHVNQLSGLPRINLGWRHSLKLIKY